MIDESSKQEIMEIMQQMKASGNYTIISVTHNIEEIMASDRIIALVDGRIEADEEPYSFMNHNEILDKCHLKLPFMFQLEKALHKNGIDLGKLMNHGNLMNEKEVVDTLWRFNLSKSHTNIMQGVRSNK